jgi:hypothetical protein
MSANRPTRDAPGHARPGQEKPPLSLYPLLGIVLAAVLAVVFYGGLYLLLA